MTGPDRKASAFAWSEADRRQLAERGVALDEAERQLRLLNGAPPVVVLDRPCTPGDGIVSIDSSTAARLAQEWREVAATGRASRFVPASGVASRMFKELLTARERPDLMEPAGLARAVASADRDAHAVRSLLDGLPRLAFRGSLARALAASGMTLDECVKIGNHAAILDALLFARGLGYAELPKALLEFHAAPDGVRTPLEEHLREAAQCVADARGVCRAHFTVSPEHRTRFEHRVADLAARIGPSLGVHYEVSDSVQDPATDTLAVDSGGAPFRDTEGRLLFRPSGHGALIRNLEHAGGDLVFIKNIDNVAAGSHRGPTDLWSAALLGLLARTQRTVHALIRRVAESTDASDVDDGVAFALRELGRSGAPERGPDRRAWLREVLDRPLRVCGMVPNTGEPGGGPFWTRDQDGATSLQIVESPQIDHAVPAQRACFEASTHFNPVFMACAIRDARGAPYPLEPFVDPGASIVTRKSSGGRELLSLERPGLWNGAMSRWNTVFVEVPGTVFNPVKSVLDLLRAPHQDGA